jgi:hypothetical protein
MDTSGRFSREAPLDKACEVVAALNRLPLLCLLDWHKGPMPFGSANLHLPQCCDEAVHLILGVVVMDAGADQAGL